MNFYVPLISAAIAAAVALIVSHRQGATARANWVRDKRYEAYERIVSTSTGLIEPGLNPAEMSRRMRTLLDTLKVAELIAPKRVREQADDVVALMGHPTEDRQGRTDLYAALDQLLVLLREDLVPPSMR